MKNYSQKQAAAALRAVDPSVALVEIRREKAERNLSEFIRQAWPVIEPGTAYVHNWHIDLISEYLQAVNDGYLKAFSHPSGVKSYGLVVDYLIAEYQKNH